jgi:hypothetical protein
MNTFPLLETEPLSPEANHRIFTALAREMTLDAPAVHGGELVEDATISYLQPDEPTRRRRGRPWLLGLVAAAAALITVGIMARDNSARTRTGGDVTPETMPIYLPTVLPDGFTFSNANDYTSRNNLPYRDRVYRDLSKPIGARAIQITTSLASNWGDRPPGHPIIVQGRPASDTSRGGVAAIRLTEGPVSINVSGRGVSYAEVEQIAESATAVSTNPADGAVVSYLPDGLTAVVDQGEMPPNRNINASFTPGNAGQQELNVDIWPTAVMNLDQWAMNVGPGLTPATVRGHVAIMLVEPESDSVGLVWAETKGTMIGITGRGVPAEQVRQAAESVRRVGSSEWARLLKTKDIAIQDDGAPGSPASSPATTASSNVGERAADPWSMPLLVPTGTGSLAQFKSAEDRTTQPNFDTPVTFSQRLIYRATGNIPGSPAVQIELFHSAPASPDPSAIVVDGQAPFTEEVSEQILRINGIDPDGLHFRLSGRGFAQEELKTMAKAVTATWTGDRTNISSLLPGFVEVENRGTGIEQYRSTLLDYGSVSVAMNPVGSGGIESYAIATPGSLTATKVRGHDGYVVSDPATNTLRLVWVESPGLLVEVKGTGTDIATLQRLAESLQPVSTDAWKKLLATVGAKPETIKVR